ncbi:MAG: rod shape-determining protein [Candidatus Woesebacteria bacterium]
MPRLLQRIALDFGEFEMRIGFEDSTEIFNQPQSQLFSLFLKRRKATVFEKRKKIPTFASMYDQDVILDQKLFSEYLRFVFLEAGITHHPLLRLEVYVNVASNAPQTTKQLWVHILESLGVSSVTLCANAISCAVGAGFSFPIPSFALLIHLGYSRSEVAGVSFTQCLFSKDLEFSGDKIRSNLEAEIFRIYGKELTASFWEKLLSSVGGFLPQAQKGVNHSEYLSFLDEVSSTWQIPEEFLIEKISQAASMMTTQLLLTLEELSADELSSCVSNGIVLTGGLAKAEGVASYLSSMLHMPVYPASEPDVSAIRGVVSLMQELSSGNDVAK